MEKFSNIKEILKLSEEQLEKNDENISAILDYKDLKELQCLYNKYLSLEDENNKMALNGGSFAAKHYIEENYLPKSKIYQLIQELEYDQIKNPENICEDRIKIDLLKELLDKKLNT